MSWLGSSDLVVICAVPACGLLVGPRNGIRVALVTETHRVTRFCHLGVQMAVFETGLEDNLRVFLCCDTPRLFTTRSLEVKNEWIKASLYGGKSMHVLPSRKHGATHLRHRMKFSDELSENAPEKKPLAERPKVSVMEHSQCSMLQQIGHFPKRTLFFPFPIRGSSAKIGVAKGSDWIELEAPILTAPDRDSLDSWTQLVFEPNHRPVCWTVPRVNLEIQPRVNFLKERDASWIQKIMRTTLSNAEDSLVRRDKVPLTNSKLGLKQSLKILFEGFAGMERAIDNRSATVFGLYFEGNRGCHTLIFTVGIYRDLDLGSLSMEAYAVPFTSSRVRELKLALSRLPNIGIILSDAESILWKRMLPALAERCRTWEHKSTCEYNDNGAPVSTAEGETPLCSCGEGAIEIWGQQDLGAVR